MFTRLGHLAVRRHRLVLTAGALFLVVAGALGGGVFDRLLTGGFDDPDSESTRAADLLETEFGTGEPSLVLLATVAETTGTRTTPAVDDPAVRAEGLALTDELAAIDGTDDVVSYWSAGSPPPLRSDTGDQAIVLLRVPGDEDDPARDAVIEAVIDDHTGTRGP